MSKCKGDSGPGLCTFWVFAKRDRCAMATSGKKRVSPAENIGIWPYGEASPYGTKFDSRREKNTELSMELCY